MIFARLLCMVSVVAVLLPAALARAQDEKAPIGYGGPRVQMQNFMAPAYLPNGSVRFQVLTVRLVLDPGDRRSAACFSVPIVHEKFLMFLYQAKLTPTDFVGQRKDILAKRLFEVALATTGKGYFTGVEIVDEDTLALESKLSMDPKAVADSKMLLDNVSKTMTSQCR
jgi:hypothetical protein